MSVSSWWSLSSLTEESIRFTFWCIVQTQTEWVPELPTNTHHFGLRLQNFEKPIFCLDAPAWMLHIFLSSHTEAAFSAYEHSYQCSHSLLSQAFVYCTQHRSRTQWKLLNAKNVVVCTFSAGCPVVSQLEWLWNAIPLVSVRPKKSWVWIFCKQDELLKINISEIKIILDRKSVV